MTRKIYFNIFFIIMIFILYTQNAFPIGEIGIGINTGLINDPNNVEDRIAEYNTLMLAYKESNPGVKVEQIENKFVPVMGINFRYNFNYLLFRLGGQYSRALSVYRGTVSEAGVKNTIKIDNYQASAPVSICLSVPLKARTISYVGAGMTLHYSYLSITQSNPGGNFVTPDERRNRYGGIFGGYHFIIGVEFPIAERYTISGEWIHQMGSSPKIKSKDSGSTISFNVNSDIIIFGINYYISI